MQTFAMLCLRYSGGLSAKHAASTVSRIAANPALKTFAKRYSLHSLKRSPQLNPLRTFTSLRGPSRPTIFPSYTSMRSHLALLTPSTTSTASEGILDLLPKISSHPALGAIQIRCGPRNTFNPSHFVRKRRHGFLSRIRTRTGRNTLARRRVKKRSTLSH